MAAMARQKWRGRRRISIAYNEISNGGDMAASTAIRRRSNGGNRNVC